jgi:hypothetical protein
MGQSSLGESRPKMALGFLGFFCLCEVVGFELKTSNLQGRSSTAQATPPALFASGIFQIRPHLYDWTVIPLFLHPA